MAKSVIINGVTYNDVKEFKAPLASDPSQEIHFFEISDANAAAESVKDGEVFYAGGKRNVGTMPVKGAGGGSISTKDGKVSIDKGYYDGTGSVGLSDTEKAKIVAANIRKGVSILGVAGSMDSTEGMKSQTKEVTPTKSEQVVVPDDGYNCMAQVTVHAIPSQYVTTTDATAEAEHIAKGETAYVNGKKVTGTHTDPKFTLANGVLAIV